eukprot:3476162-Pleurochrysis_carterae.AAC.3
MFTCSRVLCRARRGSRVLQEAPVVAQRALALGRQVGRATDRAHARPLHLGRSGARYFAA